MILHKILQAETSAKAALVHSVIASEAKQSPVSAEILRRLRRLRMTLGLFLRAQVTMAVLLLSLFFTSSVLAAPADDVVPLIDRDYFTVTCKAMQGANKSILLVMYEAQLSVNHPFGGESLMLRELISAKNRGVDVRVILEGDPERNNTYAYDFLKNAGVNVSYDADNITTHSSFMVIDDEYTILGSHNWTIGGQRMNHEASVFIRSKDVAKAMRAAFEQIAVKKEPETETKK